MSGLNLLVIDWDFFFPNPFEQGDTSDPEILLYDWGHGEAPWFIEHSWDDRAFGFLRNGRPLPFCKGYEGFWDRFNLGDDSLLLVGDSNLHAGLVFPSTLGIGDGELNRWDRVDLYDAHHDCGYAIRSLEEFRQSETFNCEDWMLRHADLGSTLKVHYPAWKTNAFTSELSPAIEVDRVIDDGQPVDIAYDLVYLCRSGAWVPSWCDPQFAEFCGAFPGYSQQIDEVDLRRDFDLVSIQALADAASTWLQDKENHHA